ncbi:copper-binding protein [Streptomyces sp. TRM43335]|uniref:Copper-binding protein n=1 Tax=Streptomyces taklimakanensis TaxID=2569853 RepID=A0A6G2BIJ0_9ACTN|nr:cation transporter [Streptomyces taklimakanensis]MTE22107.1 copper-binding protein [Streptomyces taklimakanensis]
MSSCCTLDGSRSTTANQTATAEGTTTVYAVAGMTCGHCKATLTKVIGDLDGVLAAEAVDEAGYELTGRAA